MGLEHTKTPGNVLQCSWALVKLLGNSKHTSSLRAAFCNSPLTNAPLFAPSMSLFQQHLPPSTITPGLTYDPASFNSVSAPTHEHTPKGREKPNNSTLEEANGAASEKTNGIGNGEAKEKANEKANGDMEEGDVVDPSYIRHPQQGPYMQHRGLSICTSLGEGVIFYGLDCRSVVPAHVKADID